MILIVAKIFYLLTLAVLNPLELAYANSETIHNDEEIASSEVAESFYSNSTQYAPQVKIPATFTCYSKVSVESDKIMLKDIASCSGNSVVCDEFYAVQIGKSPGPGKQISLNCTKILPALKEEWPDTELRVKNRGSTVVYGSFSLIDHNEVEVKLKQLIDDLNESLKGIRLSIDKISIPPGEKIRPGECSIEIPIFEGLSLRSLDWLRKNLLGYRKIRALCIGDEDPNQKNIFFISAEIFAEKYIPLANRDLAKSETISKSDFEGGWIKLSSDRQDFVENISSVAGMRISKAIVSGEPLLVNYLYRPLLIRRGQIVKFIMMNKQLEINGFAKAINSGSYGEVIQVLYQPTKKIFAAKIKSSDLVEFYSRD